MIIGSWGNSVDQRNSLLNIKVNEETIPKRFLSPLMKGTGTKIAVKMGDLLRMAS